MENHGYLKISSEADRITVAAILYKNGYCVKPVRKKRNNKAYDYFVEYEVRSGVSQGEEEME